ncbi:MAG: TonB family protein [Thermodesulfobacteriota bacterium]|nr:MAG: TonB family protein [Thermodesulfobacteriota bacterium]
MKIFSGERRRWLASFMAAAFAHLAITLYLAGHAVDVEPAGLPLEFEIGIGFANAPAEASHETPSRPKIEKAVASAEKQAVKKDQAIERPVLAEPARTEPDAAEEPVEKPLQEAASLSAREAEPTPEAFEAQPKAAASASEASVETREGGREDEHEPGPPPQAAATRLGIERFETRLLAHLERNKRYPRDARLRRQEGVVYLRFVMNRRGDVVSLDIERSSGISSLDHESMALLRRSEPLPALPMEIASEQLELVVPIFFSLR